MATVRKITVKGQSYYQLVESYRDTEGKPRHRVLKHLGKDPQPFLNELARGKRVLQATQKYPDLAVKGGQAALAEYKRRRMPKIPPITKEYRTLVVDPPWPIEKIERGVRPNQYELDYPVMSLEEIKTLPQRGLLPANKEGSHIYLWTTQKHLPSAFAVFDAWDVKYQCLLTWVKNVGFTPFSWMYSTELCLFGRIGNLPLLVMGKRLDFAATVKEHSRKPDEFYHLVKEVSPEPRLDMFSRETHDGFDNWGNEVGKFRI